MLQVSHSECKVFPRLLVVQDSVLVTREILEYVISTYIPSIYLLQWLLALHIHCILELSMFHIHHPIQEQTPPCTPGIWA